MHAAVAKVTGSQHASPVHAEIEKTRVQRDLDDLAKLKQFFKTHSPFQFGDNTRLVSVSSGICSNIGDGINCDQAEEVRKSLQKQWDHKVFLTLKLCKAVTVKPMALLTTTVCLGADKLHIDPITLCHRVILVAERQGESRSCFGLELTPYPMCLFKAGNM